MSKLMQSNYISKNARQFQASPLESYDRPNDDNCRRNNQYGTAMLTRQLLLFIAAVMLSAISTLATVGATPIDIQNSGNNINKSTVILFKQTAATVCHQKTVLCSNKKGMVSYAMVDSFSPLDSYLYSFYQPSTAVSSVADARELVEPEISEIFRPGKRDIKRSDDIPGVLRFGKRFAELENNPVGILRFGKRESDIPGVLRFGKRDTDIPGVLRFGKRQVPGVLRFGKRSDPDIPGVLRFGKRSDDMMPGVLRFGKRYDYDGGEIPAGVLRFGKKSDNMPGVLRFGRK